MSERAQSAEHWNSGAAYQAYSGRWSRLVARQFVPWLDMPPGARWLDVGCGTGMLSETVLELAQPAELAGIDRSPAFVAFAQAHLNDEQARFETGDAQALPFRNGAFDVVVSGLALNFIPDRHKAVAEMARVTRPGGMVAAYVWDYAGQMQMMRYFWDAVIALDASALELDQGRRFPICNPEPLTGLFQSAGLEQVRVSGITIGTRFADFEDYWTPFLGGQGSAPAYVRSLPEPALARLRETVRARLPANADGSIDLVARAWAVRGHRP